MGLELLMPTQTLKSPPEQTDDDRMLVRLLLVAELLLNTPNPQPDAPDANNVETEAKSLPKSDTSEADV
mgnify:CR=1 FL=1